MPSVSREGSRDSETRVIRHQHSFSESGRLSIPMYVASRTTQVETLIGMKRKLTSVLGKRRWDSSDPDRAPPPLPLNPGSSSPITKPNASARIEEAAALISAKAREHAQNFNAKSASMPSAGSPEKSLIKGQHHKRMQSMQNGNVRDLSNSLERRSPDKGLGRDQQSLRSPTKKSEYERSPERSPDRDGTPTPSGRETPTRGYLSKPILGENTPPSATMLALQSIRSRSEQEAPLSNITNQNTALSRQQPQSFEALSSQILNITSIATNLQREMAQLSRRSKDNATDLISLKEATNARDEDIRTSLKELVSNISTKIMEPDVSRSVPNLSSFLLENKAHGPSPGRPKGINLPRIPSPNSFAAAIDRDLTASPSVVSSDGAASIALLEKILREMGTREGQDNILRALEDFVSKTPKNSQASWDPNLSRKLEEILKHVKDNVHSQALVRSQAGGNNNNGGPPQTDPNFDNPRSGLVARMEREVAKAEDRRASESMVQRFEIVSDDIMNILKRVKASIAEGGGLTNEVKALVRELRGEVLGMGRELARKLEQAESSRSPASRDDTRGPGREEIAHIVEGGLAELKEHMSRLIYENRRQSSGSVRSAIDPQEMYNAVRAAIAEQMPRNDSDHNSTLEKEEILSAVRQAWEDCKPEIELQNFGLEREEILDCLKQGLKSYQNESSIREVGASYEEVLDAVQKGLRDFRPPPIDTEASLTREEILLSVRECLESFDFSSANRAVPSSMLGSDLTRDDVLDAVKEGLLTQGPVTKEIEFNRNDLFDAVRAGLEGAPTPMGGVGEQVLEQMHDLISTMRTEFKQYSAANGKDTEQVLDAVKDGLEELRADIESYVDRAADVTGKDEIIDTVKDCFRSLQGDVERGMANTPGQARSVDTPELLDAMEKEFQHLRDTLNKSLMQAGGNGSGDKEEILDAIRDISESDRGSSITIESSNVAAMVKEELAHMRETLTTMLIKPNLSVDRDEILDAVRDGMDAHRSSRKLDGNESILSNTSELLDAFQDGVDGIRADLQKLTDRPAADLSSGLEILDELKEGLAHVRIEVDKLGAKNAQIAEFNGGATARDHDVVLPDGNLISTEIEGLKVMITQLRIKVEALDSMPPPPMAESHLNKDDLEEIATTLREVQAGMKDIGVDRSVDDNAATKDDTDAIETLLRNAKAKLDELDPENVAKFEHIEALDDVLREVKETIDAHKESAPAKEDLDNIAALLKEVVDSVEDLQSKVTSLQTDEDKVTKTDIQAVETLCLDTKTQIEELRLPDPEIISTKADVEQLQATMKGLQEQIDADNELTAQAFDARKTEHGGLATKIDEAKDLLDDLREELMKKLEGSEEGIVELAKTLEVHHESFGTLATATSLAELADILKESFEKSHSTHDATKLEVEERDAALMVKHEETRAALTTEIGKKLEEKFNEVMTKYDDAQVASEASRGEHVEALTTTKSVVDDLKTLIDTLGSTITETYDRMSDDAKTVFTRVDETHTNVEAMKANSQSDHALTRDEIAKTLEAAHRLEGQINEHHPAILAAIKDIGALVEQHYEHSQRSSEEMRDGISGIPAAIPPLLPALPQPPALPPTPPAIVIPEPDKYDDSQVHEKLNTLIAHASAAKESLGQMEKMDAIHQQVLVTAGEISEMVATQSRLMAEHHENQIQEAQEAAVALEKRIANKQTVELDIVRLGQEKDELTHSVSELKDEQDELRGQSKRLAREVAILETALHMRQEEMKVMEIRAESLEKKIFEGVMDHARSLIINKAAAGGGPRKKRAANGSAATSTRDAAMNLKRVSSMASQTTTRPSTRSGETASNPSSLSSAVGLALKRRSPLQEGGGNANSFSSSTSSAKERRILSTSVVTPRPSLANMNMNLNLDHHRALMVAPAMTNTSNGGLVNLKRSHSVKSNPSTYYGGRKASWGGRISSIHDKENEIFDEGEEDEDGEEGSDAATERRTSFTGTINTSAETESDLYTVTDSMTYGTGSTVSGRSASYASSTRGEIAGEAGEGGTYIDADDEEEDADHANETGPEHDEPIESAAMALATLGDSDPSAPPPFKDHASSPEQDEAEGKILALLDPSSTASGADQDQTAIDPSSQTNPQQAFLSLPQDLTFDLDETADLLAPLEPPPKIFAAEDAASEGKMVIYTQTSDSGLGSEIPTAALEGVPGGGFGGSGMDSRTGTGVDGEHGNGHGTGEAAEYFDRRNSFTD